MVECRYPLPRRDVDQQEKFLDSHDSAHRIYTTNLLMQDCVIVDSVLNVSCFFDHEAIDNLRRAQHSFYLLFILDS